jgi:hypothetical protein
MTLSGIKPVTFRLDLRVDNWSTESVVGYSAAGKRVSTKAEDIVGIRHQVTISEEKSN